MLHSFLTHQIDYLTFITAFSILIIGILFISLSVEHKGRLPWKWSACFGLLQSIYYLLTLLSLGLQNSNTLQFVRMFIYVLSFLSLAEFARLSVRIQTGFKPPPWLYAALFIPIVVSALFGINSIIIACYLSIALPVGSFAALILWHERYSGIENPARKWLGLASVFFFLYTLTTAVIGPGSVVTLLLTVLPITLKDITSFILHLALALTSFVLFIGLIQFFSSAHDSGQ